MFRNIFKSATPEQEFWKWFEKHEATLFDFEQDMERIFDRLQAALGRIDPKLTFEFGPKRDEKRDFVISADGIKSAFPYVTKLVDVAPSLKRWKFVAFRPRRSPINTLTFNGKRIDPQKVSVSLLDNGETPGLYLYIDGYDEQQAAWKQMGYLLLDEALGEFDVEMKVGLIRMYPAEEKTGMSRYPLSELPEIFDRHLNILKERNLRNS